MTVSLTGLQVENLRGFRSATLDLVRPVTILVGPNNAGKTSLLRLLDWALNDTDDSLLRGQRALTAKEQSLLLPARDTTGAARRLTLFVGVADGRRHRRFHVTNGQARLRFRVRGDRVYLNVRKPARSEPLEADAAAISLLHELRGRVGFKLIPASRDAASTRFTETLTLALSAKLRERALHAVQGGAPIEYRQINQALRTIRQVAEGLVQPLWQEMGGGLIGLARGGTMKLDVEAADLVDWIASRIAFRLTTGDHDMRAVQPVQVGSGLQSLLDLAVLRGQPAPADTEEILAVEEPEAFLHPAAQRTLARALIAQDEVRRLISTHSPILVDEAQYGDVVIVREHKVFPPRESDSEQRAAINTALMSGQGSEAMFARSVLLVEGSADKLFFEALRRRIAAVDEQHLSDQLAAVAVGGKQRFAPWMRLIESYQEPSSGDRPIEWIAVGDGADAASHVRRALRDTGITIGMDLDAALHEVSQANAADDEARATAAARAFNQLAVQARLRAHLLPIDLEWCCLQSASAGTITRVSAAAGLAAVDKNDLLRKLGSKHGQGPVADAVKHPWIRGLMGRDLPWSEVSPDARLVLTRWLRPVFASDAQVEQLLRRVP
jgi:hypothetical protein